MASFPYYTLNFSNAGTTYSTFLTGIRGFNLTGMYLDANGNMQGLLYNESLGTWTNIDFPNAADTTPYGLSFGSYSTGMDIVGSYKLPSQATDTGFLLDTSAPVGSQWTTLIYPGATDTIPHSTFNGLVVGNWDVLAQANPDYQTYPSGGNAFIYNISTKLFTLNDAPNSLSTTAYGIYDNLIAGGYANSPVVNGIQPTHGYIYDMSTQIWHTYDHPGAVVTHFEGITGGNSPGAYTLIGDWVGASEPSGSPEHPFILRVQNFVPVSWTDFNIPNSATTSGNSVYGDTAIGIYTTDPSTGTNGYVATIQCFVSGTGIATPSGEIAVERLRPGMLVQTASGAAVPVSWLGRRTVACRSHPQPESVWPVRVRAAAFGDQMPERDLWLSPDHAVFVDDVLIPIRYLLDGTTIAQVPCDTVTYWHVELPRHDVILAEGLPVESYLETGGRAGFVNGGDIVSLYPDFASRIWEAEGCAPLLVAGAALDAVRERVAAAQAVASSAQPSVTRGT
jgi:hypothetical protein